ncbi:YncE family protein [Amycolatopsis anabasis]|uniref:YncE family protein n=1 Tax=Amycolatopsis anabasis TaxID=1840409 RepID=UPI00131D587D|nr:YncE family protein [Amycolatopsis anabasis]
MTETTNQPGDLLAVVSQSGPTVTFFDAVTHEKLDVLEVPPEPHELCFDPDRRVLYCVSTYHSGYYHDNTGRARELTVIDVATREVAEVIDLGPEHGPHGLALDRARNRLYVSVEANETEPGGVLVLDTERRAPIDRIPTGAPGPHWFAITPDGRRGYATNKEAPFVSVVDLETGTMTGRIDVPGSEGLDVSPDGRYVYVAAPKGDFGGVPAAQPGIRVIEVATGEIVGLLPTEHVVFPVHVTGTGLILAGELSMAGDGSALGEHADGALHVYAPETHRHLGRVAVGRFPLTITSSPDGRFGYVANVDSSTVSVVDLTRLEPVAVLEVARSGEPGAHGLAYLRAGDLA